MLRSNYSVGFYHNLLFAGTEAATTALTITATADAAVTGAQTVTVSLSGTGLSNADFSGATFPAVITILNGQTTGTLNFSVADDASVEGTETATFDISAVSAGLTIGTPFNASLTITDNDAPLSCSDIYISEYVEGSGSNKYIEIYNPTSSSIDLGAGSYSLRLYANGASTPSNDVALTGVIPAYGTIVYKNGSATVYAGAATTNAAVNFNGDDAVAIAKAGVNIDIFGVIGTDPGSSWSFGGNVTADMSLRRNADKNSGVNVNPGTFAALGTDWTAGSGIDDVSGLGAHVSDCFVPSVPTVSLSINSGTITEGSAATITLTATATGAVTGNQTINLTVSGASNADFSGITFPAAITILNGQTTGTASFTLVDDAIPEGIENAVFAISSTTAGVIAFAPTSAALTISDNDIPQIIINEIMYNNSGADEEWIELYNAGPYSILFDNNWNLTNSNPAWNHTFSTPIGIAPGGYLTIQVGSSGSFPFAADVVFSSTSNQLVNSTSTITLLQNSNVVDVVTYGSTAPWPVGSNGGGASLALNLPSLDNSNGANWGDCKVNGSPGAENPNCNSTIYYTYSSGSVGSDIWVTSPTGTVPILANFTSGTDLVIRAGHTVLWDASAIPANNVSLQYAGRIWRNSNLTGDMTYLSLYGNLSSNNGIIGNGNTFDAFGINIEGVNSTISGTGVLNIGRIRKNASDNTTSTLNINANLSLRYPGAAIYNNQPSTTFNINLAAGKTVSVLGDGLTPGDVSVDGTNGIGAGERAGVYTINGTLNVSGTIYALTDNTNISFVPGITVGSTGRINVETLDMRFDGLADVGFNTVINSGGRITVNGLMLQREGSFNANGGLVLNNGASLLHGVGTPGLAPDPGGLVTGNVIVNINANSGFGKYNFWSSPVTGASILSITQAGAAYGAQNNTYEYNPVNSTGTDIEGLRDGWVAKTNSDIMVNGRGYITNSSPSARFTGPANNGNINIALTGNGFTKFNLIGNPYPSSLDAAAFLTANGPSGTNQIVPAIYFWDDDGSVGAAYDAGDYVATNSLGTSSSGGNGSGTFTGAIAAGQGFFLEASPAGTNVQFTNAMRNSSSAFFFEAEDMTRVWLKVSNTEDVKNETLLAFLSEATDGYDAQFDAKKFPGNEGLALFTTLNENAYAIQAWEKMNIERVIPVGLNATIPATHTFSLSQIDNLDPTVLVYLEDRELGTMTNLRVSDYSFNVTEAIEGTGRFFLHFSTPAEINATAETCSGNDGSIRFEASNAWNYTIRNSENIVISSGNAFAQPLVNDLTAGDYVITMSADGYSTTLVSTVAATTPVSVSIDGVSNTSVNTSAQFAAVASGSQTISWDFGDGSDIVTGAVVNHAFENAGIYTVTAFVSNDNCSTQQSMEVRVEADVTGINALSDANFGMFPNPAATRY
ncbi:MAG: lamin tail domain-containing protein [Bacteroidia bacterium]